MALNNSGNLQDSFIRIATVMEDIVLRNEYKVLQKSVVDCSKFRVIVTVLDVTLELLS